MAWTSTTITSKIRDLTGEQSASQWSDANILIEMNHFYQNIFPFETRLPELWDWYEQVLAASESGEYSVADTVLTLEKPVTLDDGDGDVVAPVRLWLDKEGFYSLYPEDDSRAEGIPLDVLWYGSNIYVRPKADAAYTLKFAALEKPTALSGSQNPVSNRWGPAIAYGTAIQRMNDKGDPETAAMLNPMYQYHLANISRKGIYQRAGLRSRPGF